MLKNIELKPTMIISHPIPNYKLVQLQNPSLIIVIFAKNHLMIIIITLKETHI